MHYPVLPHAFFWAVLSLWSPQLWAEQTPLTLTESLGLAISADPWLRSSELREQAIIEEGEANARLPDPRIKLMAGNLPIDTWSLSQEPMTQLSVGIQQRLPRGDSLALTRQSAYQKADTERLHRDDRQLIVEHSVTKRWLALYEVEQTLQVVETFTPILQTLQSLFVARYRSGNSSSQKISIVGAELALMRLEDQLTILTQRREVARGQLAEWVGPKAYEGIAVDSVSTVLDNRGVVEQLLRGESVPDNQQLLPLVQAHPQLAAIDAEIGVAELATDLAYEQYKPAWALEASYGHRADSAAGLHRADLFSVGISFDVPLFGHEAHDRKVRASKARASSIRMDQQLAARQLLTEMRSAMVTWRRLEDRKNLYLERLLPQIRRQTETTESAYTNDQGDLTDVIRTHLAALDAKIQLIAIESAQYSALAELRYLTATHHDSVFPKEPL